MIHKYIGEDLLRIIDYLENYLEISTREIAKLIDSDIKHANKVAYRWVELGWLKRSERGKAVFKRGWKLLGQREHFAEGTIEARVFGLLLTLKSASFLEVESVLRDAKAASRALRRLIAAGWAKLDRKTSMYSIAPDPFVSEGLRERVRESVERFRAGTLLGKKLVQA